MHPQQFVYATVLTAIPPDWHLGSMSRLSPSKKLAWAFNNHVQERSLYWDGLRHRSVYQHHPARYNSGEVCALILSVFYQVSGSMVGLTLREHNLGN